MDYKPDFFSLTRNDYDLVLESKMSKTKYSAYGNRLKYCEVSNALRMLDGCSYTVSIWVDFSSDTIFSSFFGGGSSAVLSPSKFWFQFIYSLSCFSILSFPTGFETSVGQ